MIEFENIEHKLSAITGSANWLNFQHQFNNHNNILLIGHGGNLGVIDHLSTDISRLTDKMCFAPGSGIVSTSLITDFSFSQWLVNWITIMTRGLDHSDTMVVGFSCSVGTSSSTAIMNALDHCVRVGIPSFLITARPKPIISAGIKCIITDCVYYHTSEVLSMMLLYELIHSYTKGDNPPKIRVNSKSGSIITPPGNESDSKNIAIDFDGVIHDMNKGWYDGTCYGVPINGSLDAIRNLSQKFNIIVHSSKCLPDRPTINGKTGKELIREWLKLHGINDFVKEVTHEKVRARFYIDDKAILFDNNWNEIMSTICRETV